MATDPKMIQDFWRRWSQDYLNTFLQRYNWANQTSGPSVGDKVLVKEHDLPSDKWLLGNKIETKHPGPDAITRVLTLRVRISPIKGPVPKLCELPLSA